MNIFGFLALLVILGYGFWFFRSIGSGKDWWRPKDADTLGQSMGKLVLVIGMFLGVTAVACFFMWLSNQ